MYFGLSEEQSFFQDNVRKYLEEHATIDNIKHITSGDKKNLSSEIHQGFLNLGINGLLIPEEFGGLGLDLLFATVGGRIVNNCASSATSSARCQPSCPGVQTKLSRVIAPSVAMRPNRALE